ncbi:hypothetical protein EJ05DRAFT_442771 [Pseudovirgaria hyperparasitica]|uniref:Heavy metal tolerance protein n=1 Tax=Pseudovirgaria hyperparasitica TaxID=470096 RepID=A0A6A6VZG7_9PEZI|nr:uncharacterized protein EJ05DRAFT_442771 [Pseudovirgaria hyperparasitica]KAF2755246.1 hypothetical protein EJ05DRAFT_442771 [Pseudovirgaria hyperparasitica]
MYLHYAYPIALLLVFLVAFTYRSIRAVPPANNDVPTSKTGPGGKPLPAHHPTHNKPKPKIKDDVSKSQKHLFYTLAVATALTFFANSANVVIHAVAEREHQYWCGQPTVVYLIGSFFIYLLFFISLIDGTPSPTSAHMYTWFFATIYEVALLALSFQYYTHAHNDPSAGDSKGPLRTEMTEWEILEVTIDLIRVLLLIFMMISYVIFVHTKRRRERFARLNTPETARLLDEGSTENGTPNGAANGSAQGYGSIPGNGAHGTTPHTDGWVRPTSVPARGWWEYIRGYSVFFPYLWPSKDTKLKVVVVACFVLVLLQRVVNLAVPNQVKIITNALVDAQGGGPSNTPWAAICVFIFLKLLQGSNGLLAASRSTLWIPISQYSYRELSVAAFEHVHGLSLEFHISKKTGEVVSALNKGTAINTFLEQITFNVLPMLVDLVLAFGYFLTQYDAYYALVVAVVTFWYVYITIRLAQWRADIRRQMVNAGREEEAVKNDSMVSYENVKYFNAEEFEFNRYRQAVNKFQFSEYKVLLSLNLMNVCQNLVFMLGLMVACFLAAHQVTTSRLDVGSFSALVQYFGQLQSPLNFFGTFYRTIQSAMINSERMLELFKEQPTVVDKAGAGQFPSCEGDIRFNNVHFTYDTRKPALQGLDFHCAPGTTTALVGESGGGKSTVFRILFRFYNAVSGNIQIDGHDVEDITIDQLRRHIGVVPQDTVLFNESVMFNLKYARPDATDEEVYEACRAASIHDKIISYPDKYEAKVGDRGLRLSGGEKQRVAIARTILKNPRIILLDEATAALDTETEEHIQKALTALGNGRTMLVIAHRLSTITTADQILVLHEGRVAERGTHEELLEKKGRYANMWKKQVRAQRAAEEAKALKDKAERLRRESKSGRLDDEASSQSEDEKRVVKSQASKSQLRQLHDAERGSGSS